MSNLSMRLYERGPDGKIVRRIPGVWSSQHDSCVDCGTTERPHEARGRCHRCYVKHRYAADPVYRKSTKRRQKLRSIRDAEKNWQRDRDRSNTPERKLQRKGASARWYDRNKAKWPLGSQVWHEAAPGVWLSGVIEAKNNARATVRFKTGTDSIPFARLRKDQPFRVMEGQVA